MNAADLKAMTDTEIAMHASGSYGAAKRAQMIALIRRLAEVNGPKLVQ